MTNKIIKISLVLQMFVILAFGQTKVGTTAGQFLGIGVGARSVGMGGAVTANLSDASDIFWNVGWLGRHERNEVLFHYSRWFADINFQYLSSVIVIPGAGNLGISIMNLDYGTMERTTETDWETGETFGAQDLMLGLSFGRKLTNNFSIGGTVKTVMQKIWHETAWGVAADIGTIYDVNWRNSRIGVSISNFGTKMKMAGRDLTIYHDPDGESEGNNDQIPATIETDKWNLPITFRIGFSTDLIDTKNFASTISVDAIHPNDNTECLNLGLEFVFSNMLYLRTGYQGLLGEENQNRLAGGFGVKFGNYSIDYAYAVHAILQNTQHLQFRMFF
ncbi:PorV/PorQ family protein [bacterium]|nr:PorV/PorQ family protein [bacterium]